MKISLGILSAFLIILSGTTKTDNRTITGKVTAASDGSPLPGVTIILKGTTTATTTDHDGTYYISIPPKGGTLVFSFIGMKSVEVKVGTGNKIDVVLAEETSELNEVVVTQKLNAGNTSYSLTQKI